MFCELGELDLLIYCFNESLLLKYFLYKSQYLYKLREDDNYLKLFLTHVKHKPHPTEPQPVRRSWEMVMGWEASKARSRKGLSWTGTGLILNITQ